MENRTHAGTNAHGTMTRRDFALKAGAAAAGSLGAAALGGSAFAPLALAEGAEWDAEYDAVVIGMGAAGDMASLELALNAGKTVCLLESLEEPLSSSHLCGGDIVLCETDLEPGSRDELFVDLLAAAQGDAQEDLLRSYVDNAPEVYKTLLSYGIEFSGTAQVAYMSRPWEHRQESGSGMAFMNTLEDRIAEASDLIEVRTSARARRLVVEDGRVAGVLVETADGERLLGARDGVVICTGGFTQNHDLAKAYGRRGSANITPMTGKGATGDGLLMALAAGAGVSYIGAGVTPTGPIGYETTTNCGPWMNNGAVIVGLDGRRFHNEGDNYVLITQDAMNLPQGLFFQIYDTPMRKILEDWTGSPIFGLPVEPEIVGDTLEELGAAIKAKYPDFDADAMVEEVETYSQYVHDGEDLEFGRTNISGTSGELLPIETGPFYAVACVPGTTHFNGGLKTDAGQRVEEGISGEPIPGLYAAGEVTGGFHGFGYMSATAFGKAVIHGVVAARSLEEDAAE